MRHVWGMTLLAGASAALLVAPQPLRAQACKDETAMVEGSRQALVEFVATVKKESLAEFETLNHQKSAVNRLGLHNTMLGELVGCLEKAAQDTTASKDDAAAAKAQHDAAVKSQEKVQQQQGAIKDVKASKDAKALIEKLDLAS